MNSKELLKYFKSAPWKDEQDLRSFIDQLTDPLEPKATAQMLEILCNKRLSSERRIHEMRIQVFTKLASRVEDKALFVNYVQALKNGDSRVRSTIIPLLPKVNNYQEHAKLCALLKSSDSGTRQTASQAIKKVGVGATAKILEKLLGDRDFKGRMEAMNLLVPMAGHHSIRSLKSVLSLGSTPGPGWYAQAAC